MVACVLSALHTIDATLVEFMVNGWAGPWSWYCSWPEAFPVAETTALPPKLPWSPFVATIEPPPVIFISQPGVLDGTTQFLVAVSDGSPSLIPLLFLSA